MTQTWQELFDTVSTCTKCPLAQTRNNVVFGDGNIDSDVLFIGEGPGQQEDEQGKPFVGRSGKLLDKLLDIIDLSREKNMYIANIVKCRPPENRDPNKKESEACMGYLKTQIELIKPKIIVCLGRVPSIALIDPDFKVTKQHGEFFEKDGIFYMGTFHPSALLRNVHNKPLALEDFQKLREKLNEISPKTYA